MTYVVSRMWDQIKGAIPLLRRALLRSFEGSSLKTMFGRYRPERHYMRGSGPKCRLKESNQDAASR